MPMRNFRTAPVKEKVDVSINLVTGRVGRFWDRHILPVVQQANPGRTGYRWGTIVQYFPLLTRVAFGWAARSYTLAVYTAGAGNNAVLSGLMTLVEGAIFPGSTDQCVYVWFLQSAPDAYILNNGSKLTPRSGEALLDAAIVASFQAGFQGRILLHADPSGGNGLLEYYTNFGLTPLPQNVPISISTKKNDGRYFVADSQTAAFIANRHNRYR